MLLLTSTSSSLSFLVILFLCASWAKNQVRIIGGHPSFICSEKHVVQILTAKKHCAGSLIKPNWIITAAHCVQGFPITEFRIYGGATKQEGPYGILRFVDFVAIHPDFNERTLHMDVAALRLKQPMFGINIETIELYDSFVPPSALVYVSGWGLISNRASNPPLHLHTMQVPVWSQTACKKVYKGLYHITNSMMCAGKTKLRDACEGDSGGPLVYKGQLAGIVSWGHGCATRYPGVYTKVATIRNWFLYVMAQNF